MVLGIFGILPFFYPIGVFMSIAAIVLWYKGRKKLQQNPQLKGAGMGTAGLVMGITGIILWVAFWIVVIVLLTSLTPS